MTEFNPQPGCHAYQVSDQMTCPHCRLTWDMNDPEPPQCLKGSSLTDPVLTGHKGRMAVLGTLLTQKARHTLDRMGKAVNDRRHNNVVPFPGKRYDKT